MDSSYGSPWPAGESAPPVPTPAYTLFDSLSVALATFLGTPIAGTILMAVNYRRLQEGGKAAAAVAIGVVATILAIVFGNIIPGAFSTIIAVGLLLTIRSCAQSLQGPAVTQHVSQGGTLGSRWAAAGVGIAVLAVLAGGVCAVLMARQLTRGSKVTIGAHDEVIYTSPATKAEAKMVGEKLKSIGYFTDKGVTVFLSKDQAGPVVSFTVKEGSWNKPEMVNAFEEIGSEMAPLMGGDTIRVRMVNAARETKMETTAGKVMIGSKDEIFFSGSVTPADARALGQALIGVGYLVDSGGVVLYSKGGGTVISFVVDPAAWEKPENIIPYENTVRKVASSVGGLPVSLRLLDIRLVPKEQVVVQ